MKILEIAEKTGKRVKRYEKTALFGRSVAPQVGFEPTTPRLTAECYYR